MTERETLIVDAPCVIHNPTLDHGGMPCWSCWCEIRAENSRLRQIIRDHWSPEQAEAILRGDS